MKQMLWLLAFGLSAALAQGTPTPPATPQAAAGNPIVGIWQTNFSTDAGPPVLGVVTFNPDGSYREEMMSQGEMLAFWEGGYTLAPDGTLTQHETNKSPQLCFQGRCEPNDGPPVTTSRLTSRTPNSITLSYTDETGTYPVTFQRAGAAPQAGLPTAPQPCSDPVPAPGCLPSTPGASAPGTGAGAPANPVPSGGPSPWTGTYSDGDVTLHLVGPGADYLERGGQRYPLHLTSSGARLEGSFTSGGASYPVVLERTDGGILLNSGDLRFTLGPVAPGGPAQPANPLGN